MAGEAGKKILLAAEVIYDRPGDELPKLYAVFPYRLYAVGSPDLDIGRRTFEKFVPPQPLSVYPFEGRIGSWRQTPIQAASSNDRRLQLDFARPTTINEFRIKEDASSSIIRYVIECWDAKDSRWVGCFNGRTIGPDFIAPIVSRTTQKARLFIMRTTGGNPAICSFEAYNDTTGEVFNVPVGGVPPTRPGK